MNFYSLLPGGCVKHRLKRAWLGRAAASTYFSRVYGSAADSRRKGGVFFGFKYGASNILRSPILHAGSDGNNYFTIWIDHTTGEFRCINAIAGSAALLKVSTARFRDPTAHYLFYVEWDMDNADAASRFRAFVITGTDIKEITSWSSNNIPAAGTDLSIGANLTHYIGRDPINNDYLDGVLSTVVRFDNMLPGWAAFVENDPRAGTYRPKAPGFSLGKHGFYLPYIGDAGDAPGTAAEGGKDRSPMGGTHVAANDFTPANVAVADFVKDTPTNYRAGSDYRGNFATLSSVHRTGSSSFGICPLTEGRLKAFPTSALSALATMALPKTGKRYWEIEFNAGGFPAHGIANRTFLGGGNATGAFGWYGNGGNGAVHHLGTTSAADANAPNTVGDIALHYIDIDANKYWMGRRRAGVTTWMGGGDPVAGTSPTFSGAGGGGVYSTALNLQSGKWWPQVSGGGSWTAIANFGQREFANTPPAGSLTLNAAANPKPPNLKLSNAYVQAFNSGANVLTELATRRSAWGNSYVDIIKNYAAEGWRWRFGDDSAYFLDSADQANGKLAFPALGGGAAYFAHSLRVGAAYGVATGQVVHVNGAPTVVNDNLNSTRRAILLFRADAGGPHPMYHPDLTAGSLLYLNGNAAEAAATDITSIGANSFAVGAGMPSGTYRWLSLADGFGHISLGIFDGNTSADGPTIETEGEPAFLHVKCKNGVDPARTYALRGINPENRMVNLGTSSAEDNTSTIYVDFLANGFKPRGTDSGLNNSGRSYVYIAFNKVNYAPGECAAQGTAR